ncbi:hypothetical protein GOV04_00245 [Candidatus Woesearchaeota archaeon]|nr:hypothetical protein [Candidatus Woesearchaeota archaeon]
MMKKILILTLILMLGLFVLSGCSTTTVQDSNTQTDTLNTQTAEPQQNQDAGTNSIPQPPALPEE